MPRAALGEGILVMNDANEIADECERAVARLKRLRASLDPFKGWRRTGASPDSPDVVEALAPAEALAPMLDAFVREVRSGMHADRQPELEQVRAVVKMLVQALGAVEESLSRTLAPHGWKLPDSRNIN
ncbi:MAG TPA: hypothetical protein VLT61_17150 [Anaeromyxobacteraceae bacterium]|nr:hypothetical protein [Anaeromyxobacteraceae bacterium]